MANKGLKKGMILNPKGCPKGAHHEGRPTDWLKARCRELIDKNKLLDFICDVASGKDVEQKINENGEVLKIPADVKDRLKATDMILDRGYGKATQQIESDSLKLGMDVIAEAINKAREERKLAD